MAQTPNFLDPELQQEQFGIDRRRRLAEALQADALKPLQGGMVGKYYVGASPLQGLAKVMQAYTSNKVLEDADKGAADIGRRAIDKRQQVLARAMGAAQGTPGVEAVPGGLSEMGDEISQGTPGQAAVPGNPMAAMQMLSGSGFQDLAQAGTQGMLQRIQPQKGVVVGRSLLDPTTGKQVGVDSTWQAEQQAAREQKMQELQMRLQDQRLNVQDRMEMQRTLAQMQIDARREMAAQSNALRREISNQGNRPPPGFRYTPDGNMERIPGGPADLKAEEELKKKASGAGDVDISIGTLRDAYDRLEKGGGITSTDNSGIGNVMPSLSSSVAGQAAGKLLGTSNQSARNDIAMARPALLAALMKATGMSAKQMDSNAELKLWLSTATDPTLDVQSNRRALDNIEKKYIGSGGAKPSQNPQDAAALEWANSNPNDPRAAAIKQRLGVR